ncbi:MAG: hypothetical protein GXY68_07810 [Chloroflexi bacterium]|jgi:hypothetical protein|nr:hypothetical protein [Chloroflexota bacterium]
MEHGKRWSEGALYYVLWGVTTLITLIDILAIRMAVMSISTAIVAAIPRPITADDPRWTLSAIELFAWFILIAAGLGFTIYAEYRLRRSLDTVSPTSGAEVDGGSRKLIRTASVIWAWQVAIIVVGFAIGIII